MSGGGRAAIFEYVTVGRGIGGIDAQKRGTGARMEWVELAHANGAMAGDTIELTEEVGDCLIDSPKRSPPAVDSLVSVAFASVTVAVASSSSNSTWRSFSRRIKLSRVSFPTFRP